MDYIKIEGNNYVTVKQYAKLKGVTRQTVYNWIKEKKGGIELLQLPEKQLIKLN